jgi:hypothetical protein
VQPGGPFIQSLGGGGPHLTVQVLQQRACPVAAGEQPQDLVEAAPVEVGIQVAQAR